MVLEGFVSLFIPFYKEVIGLIPAGSFAQPGAYEKVIIVMVKFELDLSAFRTFLQ
jgi:hypothetical protein